MGINGAIIERYEESGVGARKADTDCDIYTSLTGDVTALRQAAWKLDSHVTSA